MQLLSYFEIYNDRFWGHARNRPEGSIRIRSVAGVLTPKQSQFLWPQYEAEIMESVNVYGHSIPVLCTVSSIELKQYR